jgi:serine/threonine-protein kinase
LCRIVHQMLAKDPARRFATARDLLRELRRVQIEHFGHDWPEDLPGWESLAGEMPVDPRVALTQQLDGLMKTMTTVGPGRRGRAWFAAALVGALALGGLVAWCVAIPPSLLADARSAPPSMRKQSTVLRQWYFASQFGTEAAWKSVITYFPEKRDFTLRAEQQLALLYLHEGDFDRAMTIFEKLAALGDDEVELQALGLAGKCVVLSLRGQYRESAEVFAGLLPIRDRLTSEPLQKLVDRAEKKNDAELSQQTGTEWDNWFDE